MYNKQTWELMPDRNMNPYEFYQWVKEQTSRHNVKTILTTGEVVYNDWEGKREEVCGTFSEPWYTTGGTIRVAYGHGEIEWLHTMAHEYTHFLQWLAWDSDVWEQVIYDEDFNAEFECVTDYNALLVLEYAGLLHNNMVTNHEAMCDMMTNGYDDTLLSSDFNAEEGWWTSANV